MMVDGGFISNHSVFEKSCPRFWKMEQVPEPGTDASRAFRGQLTPLFVNIF